MSFAKKCPVIQQSVSQKTGWNHLASVADFGNWRNKRRSTVSAVLRVRLAKRSSYSSLLRSAYHPDRRYHIRHNPSSSLGSLRGLPHTIALPRQVEKS